MDKETITGIIVKTVESHAELEQAMNIRRTVFIEEQSVAPEIEMDSYDGVATHVIATINGKPVGTARWRQTAEGTKLERFAVLKENRGKGVGEALVEYVLDQVKGKGKVYLHAQASVIPFYEKYSFCCVGELFCEANIPHRKMVFEESGDGL